MRLTSLSLGVGLSLLIAASACAQSAGGTAGSAAVGAGGAGSAAAAGPGVGSAGSYTAQNVDPSSPFGVLTNFGAGTTSNMSSLMSSLSAAQKTDLSQRCVVIDDPANANRYQQNARDFCSAYRTASSASTTGSAGAASGATAR